MTVPPRPPQHAGATPTGWRCLTADPAHGPLPLVLLLLTVVTGIVDAVSILSLGRVFVANMTGNVVFIGFALAGAPGFSLVASVSALAGFLIGALAGGVAVTRYGRHRGRLLRNVTALQLVLLAAGSVVIAVVPAPFGDAAMSSVAALMALAMGLQNAAVRALAVPDLTTTVLTMTLTGVVADISHRNGAVLVRRLLAVGTMLLGAVVGALLVLHVDAAAALTAALVLVAVSVVVLSVVSRRPAPWHTPRT